MLERVRQPRRVTKHSKNKNVWWPFWAAVREADGNVKVSDSFLKIINDIRTYLFHTIYTTMTPYKWKYTFIGKYIDKIIIAKKLQNVCGGQSSNCFWVGDHLLSSKQRKLHWTEKKKNRSNTHDSIVCYIIRTKNRSSTALNYIKQQQFWGVF